MVNLFKRRRKKPTSIIFSLYCKHLQTGSLSLKNVGMPEVLGFLTGYFFIKRKQVGQIQH